MQERSGRHQVKGDGVYKNILVVIIHILHHEKMIDLEETVTRDPRRLFLWIRGMNANSEAFDLAEDHDKVDELRKLCTLFSQRKIPFNEFLYYVLDFDLFD